MTSQSPLSVYVVPSFKIDLMKLVLVLGLAGGGGVEEGWLQLGENKIGRGQRDYDTDILRISTTS